MSQRNFRNDFIYLFSEILLCKFHQTLQPGTHLYQVIRTYLHPSSKTCYQKLVYGGYLEISCRSLPNRARNVHAFFFNLPIFMDLNLSLFFTILHGEVAGTSGNRLVYNKVYKGGQTADTASR